MANHSIEHDHPAAVGHMLCAFGDGTRRRRASRQNVSGMEGEQEMSRYIDADDVANAIYHHFPSVRTMTDARGVIEEAPSIDIVRCKECKKRDTFDCGVAYYDESWDEWHYDVPSEEWFCADGEREDE